MIVTVSRIAERNPLSTSAMALLDHNAGILHVTIRVNRSQYFLSTTGAKLDFDSAVGKGLVCDVSGTRGTCLFKPFLIRSLFLRSHLRSINPSLPSSHCNLL